MVVVVVDVWLVASVWRRQRGVLSGEVSSVAWVTDWVVSKE